MDNNERTNPAVQWSDEEIIHQVLNGNKAEQNSLVQYLYQRYTGMVVQLIHRLGGSPAEDTAIILDDSLIIFLDKISDGTYQSDRSSLSTYFYSIAEKKMLNRLRKRRRREKNGAALPPTHLMLNDVEEKMNSKEVREKVAAAIQQLDDTCQQILKKFWLEDKSMKEIGEEMETTVDAAKQRNHRCMKKLRDLLKADFEDWFNDK